MHFGKGLREHGYVDRQNIRIEYRLVSGARDLSPLELPGRKAPRMEVVVVQPWLHSVPVELDFQFHFGGLHRVATDRADLSGSGSAERPIRWPFGQSATAGWLRGLCSRRR